MDVVLRCCCCCRKVGNQIPTRTIFHHHLQVCGGTKGFVDFDNIRMIQRFQYLYLIREELILLLLLLLECGATAAAAAAAGELQVLEDKKECDVRRRRTLVIVTANVPQRTLALVRILLGQW